MPIVRPAAGRSDRATGRAVLAASAAPPPPPAPYPDSGANYFTRRVGHGTANLARARTHTGVCRNTRGHWSRATAAAARAYQYFVIPPITGGPNNKRHNDNVGVRLSLPVVPRGLENKKAVKIRNGIERAFTSKEVFFFFFLAERKHYPVLQKFEIKRDFFFFF